jgi:hypothetical protein
MQKHFHFDPQLAATLQAERKRKDLLYRQAARSIPHLLLIDPEGTVRFQGLPQKPCPKMN